MEPSAEGQRHWRNRRVCGSDLQMLSEGMTEAAGEIALFDRSWYNRAGVERVMGFCTDDQ